MKFDDLANKLTEQSQYRLSAAGEQLLQQYHKLINDVGESLINVLSPYVNDPSSQQKQLAITIISTINSNRAGNQTFDIMSRLDTLTNGGKSVIDPATFAFNPKDPILQYLEEIQ